MSPPTMTDAPPAVEAATAVDPRFEARRAAVEREQRRRRHTRLAAVVMVLAAALGGFAVTRSALTDVDTIAVTGWTHGERDQIVAASGITPGMQLTDLDTTVAARRIEHLVPWVAAARVSRSWPSSVRITVVERRPVAQVRSGDRWLLVDAGGHLLEAQPYPQAGVPLLEGEAPSASAGDVLDRTASRAVGLLSQMSSGLLPRVSGLRLRGEEVELLLVPTATVAFGPTDQVQMKLLALETVLGRVDQTCVAAIDVRVPRRPLVKRDLDCEGAS